MPYSKTTFVEGAAPGISAAEMNKLGTQYDEAVADAAQDATSKANAAEAAAKSASVSKLGDTMTGKLMIRNTAPRLELYETDDADSPSIQIINDNNQYWIALFDSNGAFIRNLMTINKDSAHGYMWDKEVWTAGNLPNPAQTTGAHFTGQTYFDGNPWTIDVGSGNWIGFYQSDGTTRLGYIGGSNGGVIDMDISADLGDINMKTKSGHFVNINGNEAWHAGNMQWDGAKLTIDGKAVGGVKSVQRGFTTVPPSSSLVDVTISSVTMSKSFVSFGTSVARSDDIGQSFAVSARLINSNTLRIDGISGFEAVDIAWEVVESN